MNALWLNRFYGYKNSPFTLETVKKIIGLKIERQSALLKKYKCRIIEQNIPVEIGLMHSARESSSKPLVYDLMEIFRSDLVDTEVLRFLRLKKRFLNETNEKIIAQFINSINKRLEKKHFLKDFNECMPYRYYIEVQILKFIKAVNHKEIFEPISLPNRHDSRCLTHKTKYNRILKEQKAP